MWSIDRRVDQSRSVGGLASILLIGGIGESSIVALAARVSCGSSCGKMIDTIRYHTIDHIVVERAAS